MIRTVAWAIQPGSTTSTRPRQLIAELTSLGVVSPTVVTVHHGSAGSTANSMQAPRLRPWLAVNDTDELAVLSPLFLSPETQDATWVDLYDDWSLAPDVHPLYRAEAGRNYRRIRQSQGSATVTVNSRYMQQKLLPLRTTVVPNGVAPEYASHTREGDERRRLLVLGYFFRGRTDFSLLENVCARSEFSEVIIASPGNDREMLRSLDALRRRRPISVVDWLSPEAIAQLSGARTVALIPHVVRDYTLSQDLMKVYQLLALGLPIIAPRMLWPSHLPKDHCLLLDHGVSLDAVLGDWIDGGTISDLERKLFADTHSWRERAKSILALLTEKGETRVASDS